MAVEAATTKAAAILRHGIAQGPMLVITLVIAGVVTPVAAQAAELLSFEFKRDRQRYEVSSVAYIDVAPEGVYAVLTNYAQLSRISSLVVESKILGTDEDGYPLVYTLSKGCLAMFCRSLEKVERLRAEPFELIITDALSEQSDVAFSHSEWRLQKEGRGTRLAYQMSTDISFWVPPVIGNYVLSRWLEKGATNAVQRIEYFAWQSLYGDDTGPTEQEPADATKKDAAEHE